MYNWPERKKLRFENYNYSDNWFYFITICTKNRENYFREIIDWKMILNEYGEIVKKCWQEIIKHYQNIEIDEFIIMPNHFHGIIILVGNEYFRSDNWNINFLLNEWKNDEYFWIVNQNVVNYNNNENRNENIHSLPNISNIIKWFKIWCTKEIRNNHNDFQFAWQKSFYDVIIKNDEQLQKTRQYILDNPIKWKDDINYKSE